MPGETEERYCAAPDCGAMFLVTKRGGAVGDRGGRGDRGRPKYCSDRCCWRHRKQRKRAERKQS